MKIKNKAEFGSVNYASTAGGYAAVTKGLRANL